MSLPRHGVQHYTVAEDKTVTVFYDETRAGSGRFDVRVKEDGITTTRWDLSWSDVSSELHAWHLLRVAYRNRETRR